MSYLQAPATALVATRCCVCNRSLLHAESVSLGMGPDCRETYMPLAEVHSAEAVAEANQIVHRLALVISGAVPPSGSGTVQRGARAIRAELAALCPAGVTYLERLRQLGFEVLASKMETAWLRKRAEKAVRPTLRIEEAGGDLLVSAPYSEAAVADSRRIPGRWWDREHKRTSYPAAQRDAVWGLLCRHYPGAAGVGPQGPFVVPVQGSV